jgi:hypothetical protein
MKKLKKIYFSLGSAAMFVYFYWLLPALPLLRAVAVACQCACERALKHQAISSIIFLYLLSLHRALFSNRPASRALLRCSDKSPHLGEDSVTVPFSL